MSPLAALVAPHAGVEPSPSSAPGPWLGHRHPHPSPTDVLTVSCPTSLEGVLLALEHHEGEARDTAGHPDLYQGPELHEALLEVALAGVAVQIGHVKPVAVQVRGRSARPGGSSARGPRVSPRRPRHSSVGSAPAARAAGAGPRPGAAPGVRRPRPGPRPRSRGPAATAGLGAGPCHLP